MAIQRYAINGNGQIEINNCAFRRNGNIEAQCALATDAENGMIVAVDKTAKALKMPADTTTASDTLPMGILYNTEHLYDNRENGLKDFSLKAGEMGRVGYLIVGDLYTSNTVCYDTGDFANDAAVNSAVAATALTTSPVYAKRSTTGAVQLVKTVPTVAPALKVVKQTTMPNGTTGFQFQVIEKA